MTPLRAATGAPWPLDRFTELDALPGIAHGITTRAGPDFGAVGTSERTARAANAAARALGLAAAAWLHQVHGGTVLHATAPGLAGEADALITATPGLAVLGRSADCPLILVAGTRADGSPAVGFAHASWRATVRGLTTSLVRALDDVLGVAPRTLRAAIAPSAGPCCYEVGDEVREEALARLGPDAAASFRRPGPRWHYDLWDANVRQLVAAGMDSGRIAVGGVCTICGGQRYWSWRVQREAAGRFAALVGVV